MVPKSTSVLGFLLVASCVGPRPQSSLARPELGRNETMAAAPAKPILPAPARAELALPPTAAFEVAAQVAQLRTAIALYAQFLDRAEGRPELEPAVQKARARIADAQHTIDFLEGAPDER